MSRQAVMEGREVIGHIESEDTRRWKGTKIIGELIWYPSYQGTPLAPCSSRDSAELAVRRARSEHIAQFAAQRQEGKP